MSFREEDPPSRDVGLGTAYERLAVYRLLLRWARLAWPRTAHEGPHDGMAGMPGLHLLPLARGGTHVTVACPNEAALARVRVVYGRAGLGDRLTTLHTDRAPPGRFELGLVFNVATSDSNWRFLLTGAAAVSERLVVIATHGLTLGAWARRALRRFERRTGPELFDHPAARRAGIESLLETLGRIEARAFVDCPWWPDLFVQPGDTLASASLARLGLSRAPREPQYVYGAADTPFALHDEPDEVCAAMRRHPAFDGTPLDRVFAHHRAWRVKVEMD